VGGLPGSGGFTGGEERGEGKCSSQCGGVIFPEFGSLERADWTIGRKWGREALLPEQG